MQDSTSRDRVKTNRKWHARPALQLMRRFGWLRLLLVAACVALLMIYSMEALESWKAALALIIEQYGANGWLLVAVTLVYAVCLAVPFVPGMEIGVLMMLTFGRPGIVMAYVGTLLGLNLAFAGGRILRHRMLDSDLLGEYRRRAADRRGFGLRRICRNRWFSGVADRLAVSDHGLRDYVLVALLLNVPGNVLIGGGGAIGLIAGLSGRLRWTGFVITVALATMAIPLLVFLGWLQFDALAGSHTTSG